MPHLPFRPLSLVGRRGCPDIAGRTPALEAITGTEFEITRTITTQKNPETDGVLRLPVSGFLHVRGSDPFPRLF